MAKKVEPPSPPEYGDTNRELWIYAKKLRKKLEQANEQLGFFRDYIRSHKEGDE